MLAQGEELALAEKVLRSASQAAGMAAYQYFFVQASPTARAVYEAALETEMEAQLVLESLRETPLWPDGTTSLK